MTWFSENSTSPGFFLASSTIQCHFVEGGSVEYYRRKLLHTTHLRDIPPSVTIVRERHPFEGRSLSVMSAIKRRGTPLLLIVLPDGTRSLIPASWTDWAGTAADDSSSPSEHPDSRLASLADLLHVRGIVDALLGRCLIPPQMSAADEESSDATEPGLSRPPHADAAEPNTPRPQSTRRGARHPSAPPRKSRSTRQ